MKMNILTVVGITALFLGLAIQPSIATVQPEGEIIDIEPKDYLFQIIIDIVNNPDVKNLFEQYNYDLFKVDIDRSVYRKIFLRSPRLFRSMIFTKPSITQEYLNFAYNQGIKITNILGEDKVLEIVKTIEVSNLEFFKELDNIISNNEELSNRITVLPESINRENICIILALILVPFLILLWPAVRLYEILEDNSMPLLSLIINIYWFSVVIFVVLPGFLFQFVFRCYELIEWP